MIKVLIVNDSLMAQQILKRIVSADPDLEVVGVASDGLEGIELVRSHDPDVVLMDIRMPNLDGVATVRHIMEKYPRPIIVVTATLTAHMPYIYDCLNLGALEAVKTPSLGAFRDVTPSSEELRMIGSDLLRRIQVTSVLRNEVKRPVESRHKIKKELSLQPRPEELIKGVVVRKIIAIGASTGGPSAILKIIQNLPRELKASIILVQHIDSDMSVGLAEWFDANCHFDVFAAKEGDHLVKGKAFVASGSKSLVVRSDFSAGYEKTAKKDEFYSPCIDMTFNSIAQYYGKNAIGVLLTGMGSDGALGLKAIRNAGGRTIAQDEQSSVVYGMPKAARDIEAAEFICPLEDISTKIMKLLEDERTR